MIAIVELHATTSGHGLRKPQSDSNANLYRVSHSSVNKHRHQQRPRWHRPRVAGEVTLHQSFRAGFQIARVGSSHFLVSMQPARQLKGLLIIGALEKKHVPARYPRAAVAPARARVVRFLSKCSGHRNDDRVINTMPYSVEVCFATAL